MTGGRRYIESGCPGAREKERERRSEGECVCERERVSE